MSLRSIALRTLGMGNAERLAATLRHRKRSYSQFGEDVHLASYYDRLAHDNGIVITDAMIVDVGAYRPIVHSNTYRFYRMGWRCINIDPSPGSKQRFDAVRPSDTNLEVAVSLTEGNSKFYLFGNPSVWNTMDEDAAAKAKVASGIVPVEIVVPRMRLETILRTHLRTPDNFEILSIDAEGFDVEILQSNDFSVFRPRVVLIEVHGVDIESLKENAVYTFLKTMGYVLYSWINPNLMFIREDSVLKMRRAS